MGLGHNWQQGHSEPGLAMLLCLHGTRWPCPTATPARAPRGTAQAGAWPAPQPRPHGLGDATGTALHWAWAAAQAVTRAAGSGVARAAGVGWHSGCCQELRGLSRACTGKRGAAPRAGLGGQGHSGLRAAPNPCCGSCRPTGDRSPVHSHGQGTGRAQHHSRCGHMGWGARQSRVRQARVGLRTPLCSFCTAPAR